MAGESSQAVARPEGRLASISRWATAPLVIPLLTGLTFAASTVFALALFGWWPFYAVPGYVMSLVALALGIGLGVPLRRAMLRIRDAGRSKPGIGMVIGVCLAWILVFLVQVVYYLFLFSLVHM